MGNGHRKAVFEGHSGRGGAVLGALHSKFQQLSESAKNIHLPEGIKHNINANLNNARDFMGLPSGAAAQSATQDGRSGSAGTSGDQMPLIDPFTTKGRPQLQALIAADIEQPEAL